MSKNRKDVSFTITLPHDLCENVDKEAEKQMRSRSAQIAWIVNEWMSAPGGLEKEIVDIYLRVKSLEEVFGVGGNAEAEAYAGYGASGIDSLGRAANYGRCQQAWSQAVFALESVIACGPQNIETKFRYRQ